MWKAFLTFVFHSWVYSVCGLLLDYDVKLSCQRSLLLRGIVQNTHYYIMTGLKVAYILAKPETSTFFLEILLYGTILQYGSETKWIIDCTIMYFPFYIENFKIKLINKE